MNHTLARRRFLRDVFACLGATTAAAAPAVAGARGRERASQPPPGAEPEPLKGSIRITRLETLLVQPRCCSSKSTPTKASWGSASR